MATTADRLLHPRQHSTKLLAPMTLASRLAQAVVVLSLLTSPIAAQEEAAAPSTADIAARLLDLETRFAVEASAREQTEGVIVRALDTAATRLDSFLRLTRGDAPISPPPAVALSAGTLGLLFTLRRPRRRAEAPQPTSTILGAGIGSDELAALGASDGELFVLAESLEEDQSEIADHA
jgi:hypothetical protein